jgi:hypothetical protein
MCPYTKQKCLINLITGTQTTSDVETHAATGYCLNCQKVAARVKKTSALMGYGEATTASTLRTCVMCAIPYAGVGHKEILVFTDRAPEREACFLANGNTMTLDYIVRTKVSYLNLGQYIFKQLPFLPPESYSATDLAFVVPRVLELTYTSNSMAPYARSRL